MSRRATGIAGLQIQEIGSVRSLMLYGAALAVANVFTFMQWKFNVGVPLMIGRGADSFCWPFWENCHAYQLPVMVVNYGLWGYLLLSLYCAWCFLTRRVATGYWLLVLVNLLRLFVMLQDYRLRANQHYMLNWVVFVFLFLPYKRAMPQHVLVSLYFWAGVLKLDRDWLTGASLYSQERLWFPRAFVPEACLYVVALEMVLIWGLYARRAWIFYATLAQLVLFHLTSWPIVGFWYPTLMFCLLTILPLTRLIDEPAGYVPLVFWREPARRRALAVILVAAFGLLQMVPHAFPGDTAITGEGRLFALHMFDALVECDATVTYHLANGRDRTESREETERMAHRSRCDPLVYYSIARNQCERIARGDNGAAMDAAIVDLDVRLRSKRNSSLEYQQVLDIRNFCAARPRYSMVRHNGWIGAG